MRRREFLTGGVGAVAGVLVGRYGEFVGLVLPGNPRGRSEVMYLDTWLEGLDGMVEVGERQLQSVGLTTGGAGLGADPAEADALARSLGSRLRLDLSGPVRVDLLERRIRDEIEEDYSARRICDIDGWQLSETECEIARIHVLRRGVELSPDPAWREERIVTVDVWGPQSTEVGTPFNVQRDGHSGLWFRARGAPNWLKVSVDGDTMPTFVTGDVVTSGVHGETMQRVLANPGRYPIVFLDEVARVRQPVGHLEVRQAADSPRIASGDESSGFCSVEGWGPRETVSGVAVNPLEDGSIGLWLRTACAPPRARLRAGDLTLETTVRKDGRVTGRLPLAAVGRPGSFDVSLFDPDSGESMLVGTFIVRAAADAG